jgi:proline iminopeptidase
VGSTEGVTRIDEAPPIGDPAAGRLVDIGDTRLWVLEMGEGHPLILLHGGPGLDHTELRPWLDPLSERFRLVYVDQRSHGRSDRAPEDTWTLDRMAEDVSALAKAMDLDDYAVFGQSFGSFVALQHAVDHGAATHYVLAGCVPSARWLDRVEKNLAALEPPELRERVMASWERESTVQTEEEVRELWREQLPFHFAAPRGEAFQTFLAGVERLRPAPDVLRVFALNDRAAIEVEEDLPEVTSPVLVIAGDTDRVTVPEAGYAIAEAVPRGDFVILRDAGHMMFVESPRAFRTAIEEFFDRFPP